MRKSSGKLPKFYNSISIGLLLALVTFGGCAEEAPEQSNSVSTIISTRDLATSVVAVDRTLVFKRKQTSLSYLLKMGLPRYEYRFDVYVADWPSKKIKKIADISGYYPGGSRFLEIAPDHVLLEVTEDASIWDNNYLAKKFKITFDGEMSLVRGSEKLITFDEASRIRNSHQNRVDRSIFVLDENKELAWKTPRAKRWNSVTNSYDD